MTGNATVAHLPGTCGCSVAGFDPLFKAQLCSVFGARQSVFVSKLL